MPIIKVSYERTWSIAQYEPEKLYAEYLIEPEEEISAEDAMAECRRVVVQNSTRYLEAIRKQGQK